MDHETLEQAALGYLQKFERTDAYSPRHMEKAFKAGATWREQQAASGFDEWFQGEYRKLIDSGAMVAAYDWGMTEPRKKIGWQASQLSSAKLLAEKDAEIKKLKQNRSVTKCYSCGEIAMNQHGCKMLDELSKFKDLLVEKEEMIKLLRTRHEQISNHKYENIIAEKDAEIERLKEILDTINKRGEE